MTVIAGVTFAGTAVLVGDILASADASPRKYVPVPTVEDPEHLLWKQLGYAGGLFQKLALISPYLCIAWAGSSEGAARVAEEMRHSFGVGPVSQAALSEYMDDLPRDSQTAALSLIVLAIYEDGGVDLLARRCRAVKGLPAGMIAFCAGSGYQDAADLLWKRGAIRENGTKTDIALGLAHKLAGTFHARESAPNRSTSGQNPLLRGRQYGAGFGVAILRDGQIVLESNTTLQFWQARLSRKGTLELHLPELWIRRSYEGKRLLLRSARISPALSLDALVPRAIPHAEQLCLSVPQVDEDAAAEPDSVTRLPAEAWPPFETEYEGQIIRVTVDEGPSLILSALQRPQHASHRNVSFAEIGNATLVSVNPLPIKALRSDLCGQLDSPSFRRLLADLQR